MNNCIHLHIRIDVPNNFNYSYRYISKNPKKYASKNFELINRVYFYVKHIKKIHGIRITICDVHM